jgi:hypothetical protein
MAEDEAGKVMSEIEVLNAVANTAKMAWCLREKLIEEGAKEGEALQGMLAYLHGVGGGKFS